MLLYSESDNLTLDPFERIRISKLLDDIIEVRNSGFKSLFRHTTIDRNNIALHSDGSNINIIQVFICLSDNKTSYRLRKEKIFSSHVNIYSHFFHVLTYKTYNFTDDPLIVQALRTIFKLKQLKILLGKVRVRHFKEYPN